MHKAVSMKIYSKEEFVKVMHFNVLRVYVTILCNDEADNGTHIFMYE